MASYNHVVLIGNLVNDVELRRTPNGTSVTDVRLAVDDVRKNAQTLFIDVTLWGRIAEVASEYLKKGSPLLVSGQLQMENWETPEGIKRSKISVVADRMKLLSSGNRNGDSPPKVESENVVSDPDTVEGGVPF